MGIFRDHFVPSHVNAGISEVAVLHIATEFVTLNPLIPFLVVCESILFLCVIAVIILSDVEVATVGSLKMHLESPFGATRRSSVLRRPPGTKIS
jgi:hypothetical protein